MVMFAPTGIAGLLAMQLPLVRAGQFHRVLPWYVLALVPGLIAITGVSLMVEMCFHLTVNAADGRQMSFAHVAFDANSPLAWAVAAVLLTGGFWLFRRAGRKALEAYGSALEAARNGRAGR
jgi:branched-chain amino acid transport system permease protein